MKKEEIIKQSWFTVLKASNRDLIYDCGKIERVAEFLGVSIGLVGSWNAWNSPELMPLPEVVRLEAELGRPVVSKAIAGLTGATVTHEHACESGTQLVTETAKLTQEFSEFLAANAEAWADGKYTMAELRELLGHAQDMAKQLAKVISTVLRKMGALGGRG